MTLSELLIARAAFIGTVGQAPRRATVNEDPAIWLGERCQIQQMPERDLANVVRFTIIGFDRIEFVPEQTEPIICHLE